MSQRNKQTSSINLLRFKPVQKSWLIIVAHPNLDGGDFGSNPVIPITIRMKFSDPQPVRL